MTPVGFISQTLLLELLSFYFQPFTGNLAILRGFPLDKDICGK